ncbi:hypothetical protein K1719_013857 [Acacia pycnantha]|nr:hypothetical protein K1719_013857 [Acacia pycnantha]
MASSTLHDLPCGMNVTDAIIRHPTIPFLVEHKNAPKKAGCFGECFSPFKPETGSLLQGLPIGSDGIIGLARTELALPAQLSSAYKFPLKFSLCLPSSNVRGYGDMLVGAQDYGFKVLKTTPLIVNPVSTAPVFASGVPSYEYFIDVKSVRIDDNLLVFDLDSSKLSFSSSLLLQNTSCSHF